MNKQVIVFDNSISALEYLKNNECDLLFTDINMPNINGKDLSLEIRKINTKIKIIAISGDDLSHFDIFDGFLNKPFSKYDIQNIINKL